MEFSMTRMRFSVSFPFVVVLLFLLLLGFTQPAHADVTLQPLVAGLSAPVDIANAGDGSGRLFIVEQSGKIHIIQNGTLLPTPFLDIQAVVSFGGERGLLGLAFHPQYVTNGRFFVFYTSKALNGLANGDVAIARYQRSATDANLADANSGQVVLSVPHSTFDNHNGGALRFGPDGYLYIGVGDGGSGGDPFNAGQDLNSLLAKILRIDVNGASSYVVPSTNPFVATAGARPEIWAYGVRNPFRFSFDRGSGDFYIGDVGQGDREEVDRQIAGSAGGANYGWRIFEGLRCFNSPATPPNCTTPPADYVPPIFDYPHTLGQSITGGYVYRGTSTPDILGKYMFADFVQSKIFVSPIVPATFTQLTSLSQQVSTFGESESGELYLANYSTGTIYSFSSSTDATPDAFTFTATRNVPLNTAATSNPVRITGLGPNANISVVGGQYSIGCTAAFTTTPGTIANNATVCVRHTSANANNATVTTTLTVGSVAANFTSTTAASFALLAVQSRKTHGAVGSFDVTIDTLIAPNVTVEPRVIGAGHTIVFQFTGPIATPGTVNVTPVGVASAVTSGNDVVVTLTAVPDNQRVTVSLIDVNGGTPAQASIGFSVGDVNNTRSVSASDISSVKARSGQATSGLNFRFDVNATGAISAADISAVKARSGSVIP